jgi:hypothetical protein
VTASSEYWGFEVVRRKFIELQGLPKPFPFDLYLSSAFKVRHPPRQMTDLCTSQSAPRHMIPMHITIDGGEDRGVASPRYRFLTVVGLRECRRSLRGS